MKILPEINAVKEDFAPKAPAAPGVKKPPIVSTSWSFTDNEPDTK